MVEIVNLTLSKNMAEALKRHTVENSVTCSITVADVLDAREEFSTEQAELFMEQNGKYIVDAMSRAAFEAVENLWLEAE